MLKRVKRFFTARTTVLVLILLLAASLAIAVIVPQAGTTVAGAPSLGALLGFNRVFSSWWFITLALLFIISLLYSTVDQFKSCRGRTFQLPSPPGEGAIPSPRTAAQLDAELRAVGYRRLTAGPGGTRYVKAPFGYWGSFLLHLGMTLTAVSALFYVVTEHRVIVRAVSGDYLQLRPGDYAERRGILAGRLPLPAALTLVRLAPEFWEGDQLKALASELVFFDNAGKRRELTVALSDKTRYHGLVVYQQPAFGNAFLVEFTSGAGNGFDELLPLPMPARRDKAGYGDFPLAGGRYLLKAKYYATADRSGIIPVNPQLVLRLYDGPRLVAETALLIGKSGQLGPYSIRLAEVRWWTDLLFDGSRGTAGIFSGFALLLAGGLLAFFAVPREVVVRPTATGCTVSWRASRFADFYDEERTAVLARCRGESAH
ncbi:cytochrome c biogenesis protein ResB [Geotalea uraniireducens]|uniref:Cytochrome c biogenesis protein ResB n=1 Tax=Geotalea uraniireducens TaxID=351604 RepID=A0ABN6VY30_9BACT|nr:cytochrome c biogenesis protein ResB [Geotalea uraniireducens]BDV44331.1 cytochrome c biogenesis protein ResB [Geotalea uraniireducens]